MDAIASDDKLRAAVENEAFGKLAAAERAEQLVPHLRNRLRLVDIVRGPVLVCFAVYDLH